ncbi:MAG: FRG domain-containing protein, partial [Verrucomicrobiota bacterium]
KIFTKTNREMSAREIETIEIENVESFLEEMVPQLGFQRTPVYRGHASMNWKLLPGLFREKLEQTEFPSWSELEGALLMRLKQRARGELGYEPTTELEWMSTAACHGLPTRFSAWTENALVALYFATAPSCDDDGVVWRILPGDSSLVISQDYEQLPERPRLYLPQKTTPAMLNQKTCFLSHPLPAENAVPESFEEHYELGDDRLHLTRIAIPAEEKGFIRRRLATMGIDAHSLFPGLNGLCAQIRDEVYCHTDSYEWVFPG